jgi:large subunit ribosomal protein L25
MSEKLVLEVQSRDAGNKGVGRRLRAAGEIPAVIYGGGAEARVVATTQKALMPILTTPFGFNNVFIVKLGEESFQCMIKERQFHPVKRILTHLDFYIVSDDQVITVDVPVSTIGKSVGERAGGRLQIVSRSVRLKCAIKDIPSTVVHDVTPADVGEAIYIDQMTPPEGCEFVYRNRYPVIRIARKRGGKGGAE